MSWLLGFGIPLTYIITGFYLSRAVYRSRHKRGHTSSYDLVDTQCTCATMVVFWPVFAPVYFLTVACQTADKGNPFYRFYNHNLPETDSEKKRRLENEAYERKMYIEKLEIELGMRPKQQGRIYSKELEDWRYE